MDLLILQGCRFFKMSEIPSTAGEHDVSGDLGVQPLLSLHLIVEMDLPFGTV